MLSSCADICSIRRMRPLLGTFVEIAAEGAASDLVPAVEAAFAAIERVHALMSFHAEDSDVARINAARAHETINIDAETFVVLAFARKMSERSDGVFDIAVAPVLVRGGVLPAPPQRDKSDTPSDDATYRDLELVAERRVRWRRKGAVDLGGIAKGYAVDRAIDALRANGIAAGLVNAGGDMRCFGKPQPIHVRAPAAPANLLSLGSLVDGAIATSADYFSTAADGRQTQALVDPRRHASASWQGSVSVLAPECMTADALTKIVRLAPERAPQLLADFDAQALVIDSEGCRSCGRPRLQEPVLG